MRGLSKAAALPGPELDLVRDETIPAGAGSQQVRVYDPDAGRSGNAPAILFLHGGGWVSGDLDTHDAICRQFAQAARCVVVAVDYRLAPEAKFPAAILDACAAAQWLFANAAALRVDIGRIAIAGDSAGGTLAAVSSQLVRGLGDCAFSAQILLYPVTDISREHESYERNAEGYFLRAAAMRWYRALYLRDKADALDWRASPLLAETVAASPPTMIVTAGFDPLCDEGLAYAQKLARQGVEMSHRHLPGQIHAFVSMSRHIPAAADMIAEAALYLRRQWQDPL